MRNEIDIIQIVPTPEESRYTVTATTTMSICSGLLGGAVGPPALVVAGLDPLGGQSPHVHVIEQPADAGLQSEHLDVPAVEGPGEAGRVTVGVEVRRALLCTALPVGLHGLVGHARGPVVSEDDLVLRRAPEVGRVGGGLVQLGTENREGRALRLGLICVLVLLLEQVERDLDWEDLPENVSDNDVDGDIFIQILLSRPGN